MSEKIKFYFIKTVHKLPIALIAATLCVAVLGFGATSVKAEGVLKVGAYGGYFKDSFDKHIFPDFTKETGIKIESVAEPTGEAWLVQLEQAARAGQAPADVNMMSQTVMLRGQRTQLWIPYDLKKIPNHKYLLPQSINRYPDGRVSGIGAVGWYITLVSNTDVFKTAPTSWADMWKPDKKNSLGLLALVSNSFLLEITAKTFFGGYDILSSKEGIL
ncbi:MAG: extracellular solute-binding protein, partial [Desulfobacterales bacterium]